jgi:group II intron reverse transcriptase/maturase
MLPDRVLKRLVAIGKLSQQGKRVKDLFRLMKHPALWLQAYANLHANRGATTKGVDAVTLDGFSMARVVNLIALLTQGRYRFKPSRRVYIPKASGTKTRPLGIPSGDDKLVQEVVRLLLERIYEPVFSADSHGFRRGRSCHTALESIRHTWTGVKWLVEVDVQSFFDTIDHDILIRLLEKKIDDRRFIKLIEAMLKAGYVEQWTYHRTYSGTPQGGVISPLLANIYLHELDGFMAEMQHRFNRGKRRARHPDYDRYTGHIYRRRRHIARRRGAGEPATPHIQAMQQQIKALDRARKGLPTGDPFDQGYRRLLYCRYADDFVIGIIGSLAEARQVMDEVQEHLRCHLHLTVAEAKSGIHHARDGVTFLGYTVRVCTGDRIRRVTIGDTHTTARTVSQRMHLHIPVASPRRFSRKLGYGDYDTLQPRHRPGLLSRSDVEIISTYNAEMRGLAQYYRLAQGIRTKSGLEKLYRLWQYSLLKTLAAKHQTSTSKIARRLRRGRDLSCAYQVKGRTTHLKVYSLRALKQSVPRWSPVDLQPNTCVFTLGRTEIIQRLNAERCEYCGTEKGYFEVHHVRKLADVQEGKALWQQIMAAMRRKTLVLCVPCHDQLTAGTLPSWRHRY